MNDVQGSGDAVSLYRLLPGLERRNSRTLLLTEDSLDLLLGWQMGQEAPPQRIAARWNGDPRTPECPYPVGSPSAPVLNERAVAALGQTLGTAGRLVPVDIAGGASEAYSLYLVEAVADCLDEELSTPPNALKEIERPVFRPSAVPVDLPAFRIPQSPVYVHWNAWAARRLREAVGPEVEVRLVWSADPAEVPARPPWGF
ncbi:hypothetical protein ACH4TU_26070 [Streptomyces physcomitrii]